MSDKDYTGKLTDGRAIYIPAWPVDVALGNLTQAGKMNIINIASLNIPAVIVVRL